MGIFQNLKDTLTGKSKKTKKPAPAPEPPAKKPEPEPEKFEHKAKQAAHDVEHRAKDVAERGVHKGDAPLPDPEKLKNAKGEVHKVAREGHSRAHGERRG